MRILLSALMLSMIAGTSMALASDDLTQLAGKWKSIKCYTIDPPRDLDIQITLAIRSIQNGKELELVRTYSEAQEYDKLRTFRTIPERLIEENPKSNETTITTTEPKIFRKPAPYAEIVLNFGIIQQTESVAAKGDVTEVFSVKRIELSSHLPLGLSLSYSESGSFLTSKGLHTAPSGMTCNLSKDP